MTINISDLNIIIRTKNSGNNKTIKQELLNNLKVSLMLLYRSHTFLQDLPNNFPRPSDLEFDLEDIIMNVSIDDWNLENVFALFVLTTHIQMLRKTAGIDNEGRSVLSELGILYKDLGGQNNNDLLSKDGLVGESSVECLNRIACANEMIDASKKIQTILIKMSSNQKPPEVRSVYINPEEVRRPGLLLGFVERYSDSQLMFTNKIKTYIDEALLISEVSSDELTKVAIAETNCSLNAMNIELNRLKSIVTDEVNLSNVKVINSDVKHIYNINKKIALETKRLKVIEQDLNRFV
ncbi:hypothetical protein [Pediococcus argentinicus]|uniref:Uncharacterized protein n=1 Tax=Pediococcus argentinicus TaxID=480391 RepID=A0A0R2NNC2_9LACO|nr:hypothetical protein [Pediococcus argentinicus]KRO25501.1 hypothetical protein IV88_GL001751 [Pediococcus argentinicus]NKZ22195.1 hypothetical protein [Pediococcus argentinicus]GEP19244.1 hypothetical protein LSA03_06280 [Pediococcus argentinicus]